MLVEAAVVSGMLAQPPAPRGFDAAAIKPRRVPADNIGIEALPGGRLVVEFCSLRDLIRSAYSVQATQIYGGPEWVRTDRYDIQAKADGNPAPEEVTGTMLRMLLRERFLVFRAGWFPR